MLHMNPFTNNNIVHRLLSFFNSVVGDTHRSLSSSPMAKRMLFIEAKQLATVDDAAGGKPLTISSDNPINPFLITVPFLTIGKCCGKQRMSLGKWMENRKMCRFNGEMGIFRTYGAWVIRTEVVDRQNDDFVFLPLSAAWDGETFWDQFRFIIDLVSQLNKLKLPGSMAMAAPRPPQMEQD